MPCVGEIDTVPRRPGSPLAASSSSTQLRLRLPPASLPATNLIRRNPPPFRRRTTSVDHGDRRRPGGRASPPDYAGDRNRLRRGAAACDSRWPGRPRCLTDARSLTHGHRSRLLRRRAAPPQRASPCRGQRPAARPRARRRLRTGHTTREAARAAVDGSALGVDLSAPMLERARRLSDDAGLRNVTYLQADAQTHPFPPAQFDLRISRFGTMFFADPVAAFANIGRALRPGARLVLLVWQDHDRNEWAAAIRDALNAGTAAPTPITNDPGPFSLADPVDHRRHPGRRRLRRGRLHRRPRAGLLRPGDRHRLRRGAPPPARQGSARRPGPHHDRARTRTAPRHRRRARHGQRRLLRGASLAGRRGQATKRSGTCLIQVTARREAIADQVGAASPVLRRERGVLCWAYDRLVCRGGLSRGSDPGTSSKRTLCPIVSFGSASCSTSSRQWSARPRPWSTWRVARARLPAVYSIGCPRRARSLWMSIRCCSPSRRRRLPTTTACGSCALT